MSFIGKRVTSSSIVSSLAVRSFIVCAVLAASGCNTGVGGAGGSTLGSAGAGLSAFQGPTIWGNLLLLALSVGIFMSTLGLRK